MGPATEGELIKFFGNAAERRNSNARKNRRVPADEDVKLSLEHDRKRARKGSQENTALRFGLRETSHTMPRHNCFSGAGRAGYTRGPGELVLDHSTLGRMQKNRPRLPRSGQRLLQILSAFDGPKAPK